MAIPANRKLEADGKVAVSHKDKGKLTRKYFSSGYYRADYDDDEVSVTDQKKF